MRIKSIIAIVVAFAMALSCCIADQANPTFKGLNDPELLQYLEETVYEELSVSFDSDKYTVESVTAIYISKESLEEEAFNTQANVYFGKTIAELEDQFEGQRFVFTLGANNETVVEVWKEYDDTYDRVIRNVAIGTGVILICVTIAVATGGAGAPAAVHAIFVASAKTGAIMGTSSGLISGLVAGVTTGVETGDMRAAIDAAALAGSESYKWGAIIGCVAGGASEAFAWSGAQVGPTQQYTVGELEKAESVLNDIIENEMQSLPGYKPGTHFGNYENLLPTGVQYMEYDINPLPKQGIRDALRLVLGNDGSAWYTNSHYSSFIRIR